ncbi:hypothetical protein LEL_03781 [Akanthomyces lecanii RCEF 1005]|uniref:Uncharacterized protein n=1 Tax=Akanthomyces lecanii RCEF 1005 TaxID=1081108 RepID=A0A168JDB9_CORDF|nr:hypothetical protein LEL_03781 [Akanthomyces lecanii RCEF 1005]
MANELKSHVGVRPKSLVAASYSQNRRRWHWLADSSSWTGGPGNTGTAVQPGSCERNEAFDLGTRGRPSCTYRRLGAMLADLREPIARRITPRTDKRLSPHRACPVRAELLVKNHVAREQERRDAPKNVLNTVNLPWRARLVIMLQCDETQEWLQGLWQRPNQATAR